MRLQILLPIVATLLTGAAHAATTPHCLPADIASGAVARDVTFTVGTDGNVGAIWCVIVKAQLPLSVLSSNVAVYGEDGTLLGANGQGYANIVAPADSTVTGGEIEVVFGATISTAPHVGGIMRKTNVNITWRECLTPATDPKQPCTNPAPELKSTVQAADVTLVPLTRGRAKHPRKRHGPHA